METRDLRVEATVTDWIFYTDLGHDFFKLVIEFHPFHWTIFDNLLILI
jgi:hypothetical protein